MATENNNSSVSTNNIIRNAAASTSTNSGDDDGKKNTRLVIVEYLQAIAANNNQYPSYDSIKALSDLISSTSFQEIMNVNNAASGTNEDKRSKKQQQSSAATEEMATFSTQTNDEDNNDSMIAYWFLVASAKQLPIYQTSSYDDDGTTAEVLSAAASSSRAIEAAAAAASGPNNNKKDKLFHEIIATIGHCATFCKPRSLISQSGVIPVLASLLPVTTTTPGAAPIQCPSLTTIHVELLQTCIYAQQYDYVNQLFCNLWPLPTSDACHVHTVFRYYYLRGIVHMYCNEIQQAMRCYETCVCIPSEDVVSAIALAAFKKLILLQCCHHTFDDVSLYNATSKSYNKSANPTIPTLPSPLSIPKDTPAAFHKILSSVLSKASGGGTTRSSTVTAAATIPSPQDAIDPDPEYSSIRPEPPGVAMHVVENSNVNSSNDNSSSDESTGKEDDRNSNARITSSTDATRITDSKKRHPQHQQKRNQADRRGGSGGIKIYYDLVNAFIKVDRRAFTNILHPTDSSTDCPRQQLIMDGNLGLVKRCEQLLIQRHVLLLSTMFHVLSITDLQHLLFLPSTGDVKILLLELSKNCQWNILIDEHTNYVTFPPIVPKLLSLSSPSLLTSCNNKSAANNDTDASTAATGNDNNNVTNVIQELVRLKQLIDKRDRDIASSSKYNNIISRANQDSSRGGGSKSTNIDINQLIAGPPRGVEDL